MTTLNKGPSETSDYACCIKELAELKEAFLDSDLENVRQRTQLKDEISKLNDECEYVYGLLEDAYAEIKRLKTKRSSGSQSRKMVLEEVLQPESSTTFRAPYSLKVTNKEYGTKYRLAEEKHKSFDGDPSGDLRVDQDSNI